MLHIQPAAFNKRTYLEDMKPFVSIFSAQNLTKQMGMAVVLAVNPTLIEFSQHEEQQAQRHPRDRQEFDWNRALPQIQTRLQIESIRQFSIPIIRKGLENLSFYYLPIKMTDRLTKDINASLKRKLIKYTPYVACQRILKTALWANLPAYTSLLIFDVLDNTLRTCYDLLKKWRNNDGHTKWIDLLVNRFYRIVVFTGKKALTYSLCWAAATTGYAVGSYAHPGYGGFVLSSVAELTVGSLIGAIIVV